MSKISEYAARQAARDSALRTALEGIQTDVATMADTIKELQSTSGEVTAEDQALIDALEATSEELSSKFTALDALNATPVAVDSSEVAPAGTATPSADVPLGRQAPQTATSPRQVATAAPAPAPAPAPRQA